jgi:predicted transcriptional regulator
MARNYHGYGENLERGAIGKSNVVEKKKKKKKTGTTARQASDQCKISAQGYRPAKRFLTKERPMLSFEQCMVCSIQREHSGIKGWSTSVSFQIPNCK